jgi:hypothetical protein
MCANAASESAGQHVLPCRVVAGSSMVCPLENVHHLAEGSYQPKSKAEGLPQQQRPTSPHLAAPAPANPAGMLSRVSKHSTTVAHSEAGGGAHGEAKASA